MECRACAYLPLASNVSPANGGRSFTSAAAGSNQQARKVCWRKAGGFCGDIDMTKRCLSFKTSGLFLLTAYHCAVLCITMPSERHSIGEPRAG